MSIESVQSVPSRVNEIEQYLIQNGPDRIYYLPNFITKEEEEYLKDSVYKAPKPRWTQLHNRRLQNWGGVPHPKGMIAEELPKWLQNIVSKVADVGVFGEKEPNHVLVNEYLSGQGIMPHLDGPLFHPTITTVNLGSYGVLNFYKPMEEQKGDGEHGTADGVKNWDARLEFSLLLEPRSLLILQETCYHHYLHGIDERTSDKITDKVLNVNECSSIMLSEELTRETRISLTIRHVPKTTKPILRLGR